MKTEKTASKRVAIKPKHARAYRKRHYVLLLAMLGGAFVLFGLAVSLRVQVNAGQSEGRSFASSLVSHPIVSEQAVNSTYGFSFRYDPRRFVASGMTNDGGLVYDTSEIAQARPYQSVVLSSKAIVPFNHNTNWLSVEYGKQATVTKFPGLTVDSTTVVVINGISFQRTVWITRPTSGLGPILTSHFITYQTTLQGQPLLIRSGNQFGTAISDEDIDTLVHSFALTPATTQYQAAAATPARTPQTRSMLDQLLFTNATAANDLGSEGISALYAPAVVKIYNAYCMDVSLKGRLVLSNACNGVTGSGFLVGSNGVIATNGHVATANPKDLVIQDAFSAATLGDGQKLVALAQAANLDLDVLAAMTDNDKLLDIIFNAIYELPDSDFVVSNSVQNLLVGLDSKDPDLTNLLTITSARQRYVGSDDILSAQLLASDYREFDGLTKYRNSDVALIKVSGNNYPIVKLGQLGEVSQGSNLSILGYPVAASNNMIVAKDVSEVTLTSGKVSAIKEANGDNRQLIETDTTIGHGNSGGPVFADSGNVVGIATYTIDGSGSGNGTFNYIRDIADLQALAASANISLKGSSRTQVVWQQAIAAFDAAHYKKSLKLFAQVRALYPQHPSIDSFQKRAEQNIAAGREARDLPLGLLIGGAAGALVLAGFAIFLIVRHHAKHQVYKLASGQVTTEPADPTTHPRGGYYYPVVPRPAPEPVRARSAHHLHR